MIRRFRRKILDRLILRPSRHLIEPNDGSVKVELPIRRRRLECFVHGSVGGVDGDVDVVVLKFPGTAGRAERSSSFPMAELGFERTAVWTWNPPGYGGSGGRASLASIADAALALATAVIDRYDAEGSRPRVYLCGNSLGCCVGLHVASELSRGQSGATDCSGPRDRIIDGLILRNPPPLADVVMRIAARYPMGHLMSSVVAALPPSMDAAATISGVPAPIVWICCDRDRLVPPELQEKLIDRHPGISLPVHLAGLDHHEPADEQQKKQIAAAIAELVQLGTPLSDSI